MKSINKKALVISLIILIVLFSILSMISVTSAFRFTWYGMNPWNGVCGIALMINRFLGTGASTTTTWVITSALIALIWWRIYALIHRFF